MFKIFVGFCFPSTEANDGNKINSLPLFNALFNDLDGVLLPFAFMLSLSVFRVPLIYSLCVFHSVSLLLSILETIFLAPIAQDRCPLFCQRSFFSLNLSLTRALSLSQSPSLDFAISSFLFLSFPLPVVPLYLAFFHRYSFLSATQPVQHLRSVHRVVKITTTTRRRKSVKYRMKYKYK